MVPRTGSASVVGKRSRRQRVDCRPCTRKPRLPRFELPNVSSTCLVEAGLLYSLRQGLTTLFGPGPRGRDGAVVEGERCLPAHTADQAPVDAAMPAPGRLPHLTPHTWSGVADGPAGGAARSVEAELVPLGVGHDDVAGTQGRFGIEPT